ncbi:unnamed protein product [Protopolystoma xenopodis]|uniref:Uncharacterized protein n=1 Tax=Protopolystoma xenopodis TaxID=117903 RepID=A0A3S5BCA5_9PLAT|nr:unnamed protein product [Protopolystoma xenopodis]
MPSPSYVAIYFNIFSQLYPRIARLSPEQRLADFDLKLVNVFRYGVLSPIYVATLQATSLATAAQTTISQTVSSTRPSLVSNNISDGNNDNSNDVTCDTVARSTSNHLTSASSVTFATTGLFAEINNPLHLKTSSGLILVPVLDDTCLTPSQLAIFNCFELLARVNTRTV